MRTITIETANLGSNFTSQVMGLIVEVTRVSAARDRHHRMRGLLARADYRLASDWLKRAIQALVGRLRWLVAGAPVVVRSAACRHAQCPARIGRLPNQSAAALIRGGADGGS